MEYSTAIKTNEFLTYTTTQRSPINITLTERSHMKMSLSWMIPLFKTRKNQSRTTGVGTQVPLGEGMEGEGQDSHLEFWK
jgi:hypothetical protein